MSAESPCKLHFSVLFLPATQLIDFPTEILIYIFKNLCVQQCLLGVGQTCPRFHSIVMSSKEIWRCLNTTAEFTTETFEVIVAHADFIESLGLIYSQRVLCFNSPDCYIENKLLNSCVNLRELDLSYNTAIRTIRFLQNMPFLKSLMVTGCTSIDPQEVLNCVYLCKTLTVLHISGCTQLENEQALELANVCKDLPRLKVLRGDVTSVWSLPSEWIDMAAQHTGVIFGNSIMNHIKRVGLPSYLYEDEQDEFE